MKQSAKTFFSFLFFSFLFFSFLFFSSVNVKAQWVTYKPVSPWGNVYGYGLSVPVNGQGQICSGLKTVYFKYDDIGNRTLRTTEINVLVNSKTQKDTKKDTDVGELAEKLASDISIDATQIKVFPNPTVESIKVQQETIMPDSYFVLYDAKGQKLLTVPSERAFEIDISSYPSGYYVLMLTSKGATAQWKISKL